MAKKRKIIREIKDKRKVREIGLEEDISEEEEEQEIEGFTEFMASGGDAITPTLEGAPIPAPVEDLEELPSAAPTDTTETATETVGGGVAEDYFNNNYENVDYQISGSSDEVTRPTPTLRENLSDEHYRPIHYHTTQKPW